MQSILPFTVLKDACKCILSFNLEDLLDILDVNIKKVGRTLLAKIEICITDLDLQESENVQIGRGNTF